MKTLKKVLCLVLALVMVVGTMAISAAAFEDDKDITNKDAAAVLNGIKVITGYENGEFDPDGKLTRDQGATIIYKLLQATDVKLNTKFADVKGTWSENAVAYCESEGIIAGYGDGNFHPADSLTAVQFAKMILVALGYDANVEGFVGENWDNNIIKAAIAAGINVKAAAWNEPITRENAAQMAFNALTATTVKYTGGSTIEINGAKISSGAVRSNDEVAALGKSFGLVATNGTALLTGTGKTAAGAPTKTYLNTKNKTVATVPVAADYTATVTSKTKAAVAADFDAYTANLNKVLGITVTADKISADVNHTAIYINGAQQAALNAFLVGDEVEVFVNDDDVATTVVVTRYEFGKVAYSDLSKSDKKVIADAIDAGNATDAQKAATKWVTILGTKMYDSQFKGVENFENGDYALVVINNGAVVASKAPEKVAGKVDAIKSSTYRIAGTYYASVLGTAPTIGTEGTWALDAQGNLAGVITAKTTYVDDYLFIYNIVRSGVPGQVNEDGIAGSSSYRYTVYGVDATGAKMSAAIKVGTDGKFNGEVITTDSFYSNNVYAYNKAVAYKMTDGYLTVATGNLSSGSANVAVSKTSSKLADGIYANDNTKFVFVKVDTTKVTVEVVTGYKKVSVANTQTSTYLYNATTKAVSTVFVTGSNGNVSGEATPYTYAYLANVLAPVQTKDANGYDVYTYSFKNVDGSDAEVLGGDSLKYITVTNNTQSEGDAVAENSLIKYTTKDGKFYKVERVDISATVAVAQADADQMNTASAHYSVANAKVYEINTADKTVAEGTLKAGQNVVVVDANNDNALEYVFIITTTSANA